MGVKSDCFIAKFRRDYFFNDASNMLARRVFFKFKCNSSTIFGLKAQSNIIESSNRSGECVSIIYY